MREAHDLGVIFDMDGTLVDTLPVNYKFWQEYLAEFGIKPDRNLFISMLGKPIQVTSKVFKETFNIDTHPLEMAAAINTKRLVYYSTHDLVISPHLIPLLKSLQEHKVPMAVGTGSTHQLSQLLLNHNQLSQYFSAVVTSDDVSNDKPAPDTFELAAKKLGVSAKKCVVVGDSANDVGAAHAANMAIIGYVNNFNSAQTIAGAEKIISDYNQIDIAGLRQIVAQHAD
ncbi:HAD family phosphatase [Candidatus Saccharibacteria bacterium]|nr:HAD family phosphatase [Candidatus Saccharibacteria bacterium]